MRCPNICQMRSDWKDANSFCNIRHKRIQIRNVSFSPQEPCDLGQIFTGKFGNDWTCRTLVLFWPIWLGLAQENSKVDCDYANLWEAEGYNMNFLLSGPKMSCRTSSVCLQWQHTGKFWPSAQSAPKWIVMGYGQTIAVGLPLTKYLSASRNHWHEHKTLPELCKEAITKELWRQCAGGWKTLALEKWALCLKNDNFLSRKSRLLKGALLLGVSRSQRTEQEKPLNGYVNSPASRLPARRGD